MYAVALPSVRPSVCLTYLLCQSLLINHQTISVTDECDIIYVDTFATKTVVFVTVCMYVYCKKMSANFDEIFKFGRFWAKDKSVRLLANHPRRRSHRKGTHTVRSKTTKFCMVTYLLWRESFLGIDCHYPMLGQDFFRCRRHAL